MIVSGCSVFIVFPDCPMSPGTTRSLSSSGMPRENQSIAAGMSGRSWVQMPVTTTKPRKRLTREESRAQTRATLIAVGRRHFLRDGLGGAVAEKIAEDAGYSRGALYSNFDGKEELFVAVIRDEQARHLNIFRTLLNEEPASKRRLKKMRDTIANLLTDYDWIVLRAEF